MDGDAWKVAIEFPPEDEAIKFTSNQRFFASVPLQDESLGVSAVWARAFEVDGKILGHVIDPRTGRPVTEAMMTAVTLASATETDALSTALLVLGAGGQDSIQALRPSMRSLRVAKSATGFEPRACGISLQIRP
jgi:thiamine biosynthesis lipoprotein